MHIVEVVSIFSAWLNDEPTCILDRWEVRPWCVPWQNNRGIFELYDRHGFVGTYEAEYKTITPMHLGVDDIYVVTAIEQI